MARSVVCYNGAAFDYSGGAITSFPGAVTSVFGRTGAVAATSGDYTEAQISFTDITTNNVSTTKHGYTPKLPNDATKYLDGTGAYTVPPGTAAPVSSVFGRTGAVVAASNDYSIGQVSGAAAAIGGVIWTTIAKASDTSRASTTTVAADPELGFTAVSGAIYEFEGFIIYSNAAGATPDIKPAWGEDTFARGLVYGLEYSTADAVRFVGFQTRTNDGDAAGTATGNRVIMGKGWHVGNGGTFSFWWAQATSDTTATVVKTGSVLRYRRII